MAEEKCINKSAFLFFATHKVKSWNWFVHCWAGAVSIFLQHLSNTWQPCPPFPPPPLPRLASRSRRDRVGRAPALVSGLPVAGRQRVRCLRLHDRRAGLLPLRLLGGHRLRGRRIRQHLRAVRGVRRGREGGEVWEGGREGGEVWEGGREGGDVWEGGREGGEVWEGGRKKVDKIGRRNIRQLHFSTY